MKRWYLVAYDIREERRLKKVAKILEGYGTRIQYSFFRCHMSERSLERLRWELSKIVLQEDTLLFLSLCEKCVDQIRQKNSESEWPPEPDSWDIV